jgi:hypothetical protein
VKILGIVITALTLQAGSLMLGAPAEAGHKGCVTRAEARRVDFGMRRPRVHDIVGTHGKFFDGHAGGYTQQYRACWNRKRMYYWTYSTLRDRPPKVNYRKHRLAERGMGARRPAPCPQPCI